MPFLNIIRASAGSGKTHFLTSAFLELLLKEPKDYFKGILAVTFTNKATAEMKARLLEELHKLASGKDSTFLDKLLKVTGFSEEHIRNKASAILRNMLHDFSWISIETIDAFFQRIIRSFTRELAIPGNYNVELDATSVLNFAVDQLIDSVEENSELLNWLISFTQHRIDSGKSWDIRNELILLGWEIFKETFAISSQSIYEAIADKDKLNAFKEHLFKTKSAFEQQLLQFGISGTKIIEEYSFQDQDFYQGSRGVAAYFRNLRQGQRKAPNKYVLKMLDGPECWASASSSRKIEIENVASKSLLPLLNEIVQYYNDNHIHYYTGLEIMKNFYSLGILSDISSKAVQYLHENNSFLLSDSPLFIYRIIDNNDTPFIYEKMGNRYMHFMIDEFQDTSGLQWANFKPLIHNSLSMGNDCLLVGDVKQSIYRWRNSNWELLAGQVIKEFSDDIVRLGLLDRNWRSGENIVEFINMLFPACINTLQNLYNQKVNSENNELGTVNSFSELYDDVAQKIPEKAQNRGSVFVKFFSKNFVANYPDYYQKLIVIKINELLQKGYSPGDIAVLVRKKEEGQCIANFLIEQNAAKKFYCNLAIISNESLLLGASESINLIVAAMTYLLTPDNAINRGKLIQGYKIILSLLNTYADKLEVEFETGESTDNQLLPKEFTESLASYFSYPLYELAERLIRIFQLDHLESETPYLHAFLDLIHEYTRLNPSDIGKFLDYWSDEGLKKSIPCLESQDALKILTIHKSKGLEFKTVIIPFCNWELNQKQVILWSHAMSKDLNYLPLIPVTYSKSLLETEFADTYLNEIFKSYVDNLNLMYVAMTRAAENIIIFAVHFDEGQNEKSIATTGDLLFESLFNSIDERIKRNFDGDETFTLGEISSIKKKMNLMLDFEPYIRNTKGSSASGRLFFDPAGFEYFRDRIENIKNPLVQGRILHEILSQIVTLNDLEKATENAVIQGLINAEEKIFLKENLIQYLNNSQSKDWFNGNGEVLCEADIITEKGDAKRPDRVVIFPDHVDIIDYKSGLTEENNSHHSQVKEYMNLLQKMGYTNVNGYLWYLTSNNIISV